MIYSWKKILKNSFPILTLAVLVEIFAGQLLQFHQEKLILFPIFLITIPVINSVGGNIGSILGARLASGLHVGHIELDIKDKNMHKNFLHSLLIGLCTYAILAILIYYLSYFRNIQMIVGFMEFVSIIVGTGLLLILLISFISITTAFWSFKKGKDPDDFVAPVVTTVGDTFGIIFFFMILGVVGL